MIASTALIPGTCLPPAYFSAAAAARTKAGLPHGAFPKTAAFLDTYLTAYANERGRLLVVTVADRAGPIRPHALGLFSYVDKLWLYEHALGVITTGIPLDRLDHLAGQETAAHIYADCLRRQKWAGLTAPKAPSFRPRRSNRRHALLATRMLGWRLGAMTVEIAGGTEHACAYFFHGRIWTYVPDRGTSSAPVQAGKTLVQLVAEALAALGLNHPFTLPDPAQETAAISLNRRRNDADCPAFMSRTACPTAG